VSRQREKPVAQQYGSLACSFSTRQQGLQLLVFLEGERISAKHTDCRPRGKTAGPVGHSEPEETRSATGHWVNWNDPPRSIDPRQQTVRAPTPNFDLGVFLAQHGAEHARGSNRHCARLLGGMINHFSQPQRRNGGRQAIEKRVRQQPLYGESANLLAAAPGDTQVISYLLRPCGKRGVADEHCATRSGGRALAASKTQNRNIPDAAKAYASQRPARTLRGILNDWNSMLSCKLLHGSDVGWIPVQVGHYYCIHTAIDRFLY
jgi:hypothetical protein